MVHSDWNTGLLYREGKKRKTFLSYHFLSYISLLISTALHNGELSDLYSLPNIVHGVKSRRMRLAGHVARVGEGRGVHRVLVGIPEGKRPLGRRGRRWEDNIKMDLEEAGGERCAQGSCGET